MGIDVRFDHVDFAYEEGKTILHDISLFAKPGQKLAFLGAPGRLSAFYR